MIVFISNFFNHHQKPVADELYHLTDGNYRFIETEIIPEALLKGGYRKYEEPYLVRMWENENSAALARELVVNADVVVYGGVSFLPLIAERLKEKKLTIEYGERWLKKGMKNLLSPNLIKWWFYHHFVFKHKPQARLCAGAYCKGDMQLLHTFKNNCYKWGYFPLTPPLEDEDFKSRFTQKSLKIIWVARFIEWKHPELPVLIAEKLKDAGIDFELNMFGRGELIPHIEQLIKGHNLSENVKLRGALPNEDILREMRESHIFLFTSDQNEGWGAVVSEAMGCGCCVVANQHIGSVPYLIKDGETGVTYRDKAELENKLLGLINHREEMARMTENGYNVISTIWSPRTAAVNLLNLIDKLKGKGDYEITEGPCSLA